MVALLRYVEDSFFLSLSFPLSIICFICCVPTRLRIFAKLKLTKMIDEAIAFKRKRSVSSEFKLKKKKTDNVHYFDIIQPFRNFIVNAILSSISFYKNNNNNQKPFHTHITTFFILFFLFTIHSRKYIPKLASVIGHNGSSSEHSFRMF